MMTYGMFTKWLAALKSGEFKQIQSSLNDGRGYCCLGVLCEVAGIEKRIIKNDAGGWERIEYKVPHKRDNKIVEWSNEESPIEVADLDEEWCEACVNLNDSDNKSFEEIAAYLEEHQSEIAEPSSGQIEIVLRSMAQPDDSDDQPIPEE